MIYKSIYFYNYEIFLRTPNDILAETSQLYLPYDAFCDNKVQEKISTANINNNTNQSKTNYIAVLPYINKANEHKAFEQSFDVIYDNADGFMIQNIGDRIILDNLIKSRAERKKSIEYKIICGDYSLNVYNTETAKFWEEQGLYSVTVSPEPKTVEQFELAENICKTMPQIIPEIICYGKIVVMRSEHCFISQTPKFHCNKCGKNGFEEYSLKDNVGNTFPIVGLNRNCQNLILSASSIMFDKADIENSKKLLCRSVILRYNVFNKNDINDLKKKGWLQL